MKISILVVFLLAYGVVASGQEMEKISLLESDSTWGKEVFRFPLGFAQEIPYSGVEEAQFPKGWGTVESDEFWSYVFAWQIDATGELTAKDLENNLQLYFDGLVNMDQNGTKEAGVVSTTALFVKKNKNEFIGKVKTFDRFRTKKVLLLNVMVEQHYCPKTQKLIIVFRFSPKDFNHDIWKKLNTVKMKSDICD